MEKLIYRILIIVGLLSAFCPTAYAYITVPSTSLTLVVGEDKFLPVPDASRGYIDHAVWACSKSEIQFREKDEAGAIIYISKAFSGTGVVEVVATEKYYDSYGRTRALTYYKQFLITCMGGGGTVDVSKIVLPELINLKVGETKNYKVTSGASNDYGIYWNTDRNAIYSKAEDGTIDITGTRAGTGEITVKTTSGDEKVCKIDVSAPDIVIGRRTDKVAVSDIKTLISNILPIAEFTGIESVAVNAETGYPDNLYTITGILIKRDATEDDLKNLPTGLYILGRKKIVVQ